MGTTEPTHLNPATLREQYGPAPWWSETHLRELVVERGLTAADIARVWRVDETTIYEWRRRYGIGSEAA